MCSCELNNRKVAGADETVNAFIHYGAEGMIYREGYGVQLYRGNEYKVKNEEDKW